MLRKQWKRVAKILMGSAFVFFFGPEECWFFYCDRHSFEPPLTVTDQAATVTVEVDPTMWFLGADGRVMDLSAFDFEATGHIVEFETHLRDGFRRIEHDHD